LADHGVDPSGTETFTVSNTGAHNFTLTCRNDAQVVSTSSAAVSVNPPPSQAGTLSFNTSASTVFVGETVTLTWNSANTTSCRAEGAWTGAKALSGSETVTPASGSNNYVMVCRGNDTADVVVTVPVTANPRAAPVLNLSASSTSATQGTTVLLSWNSSNTDGCSATGDWAGAQSTSASANVTVSNVGTNTYNLTCTGAGGSTTKTVFVTGNPVPTPTPPTTPTTPGTGGGSSGGGGGSFGFLTLLLAIPAFARKRKA
ncbi:MAG: GlyGly-CTERM sorting domain-containing protein, partial [Stagnimonas sp.]|nr:GlyGly-CTERM sorting domain-containing protein [Stagnimonas sp.]